MVFNHLCLVGIKEQTGIWEQAEVSRQQFPQMIVWYLPRSPMYWLWLSYWAFSNLLHHPLYPPESKTLTLPCSTENFTNRKNDGSCLLPKQNHNFNGITVCAGLLDSNSRQSCIFLSPTSSLKQTLLKSQCSASTSFLMFQKKCNKFSLSACGAFGRHLDGISTSRQKPMHVF